MVRSLRNLSWWLAGGYVALVVLSLALLFVPVSLPEWLQRPAWILVFAPRIVAWPWPDVIEDRVENWFTGWQIAHHLTETEMSASKVVYFVAVRAVYVAWFWSVGKSIYWAVSRVLPARKNG